VCSSDLKWKIVIGHHPVYAYTEKGESERTDMQQQLGVLLEKYGANAYICGHIHSFQHLKPKGKKVHYFVNSSAAQARPVEKIEASLFCISDPGFTACSFNKRKSTFYFINHKGECVYSYVIKK
jgi:3',5'-cyclic AMP phosphodiesterase CpdA